MTETETVMAPVRKRNRMLEPHMQAYMSCILTVELIERVKSDAQQEMTNRSAIVRRILRDHYDAVDKAKAANGKQLGRQSHR